MSQHRTSIVTLDKTLADFYNEENVSEHTDDLVALVAAYPTGLRFPNQRYVYHDEDRPDSSDLPDSITESERDSAGETLRALGAQKFSFCVGNMPLIIFDPSNGQADKVDSFRSSVPTT